MAKCTIVNQRINKALDKFQGLEKVSGIGKNAMYRTLLKG